jgi:hypothetical protein
MSIRNFLFSFLTALAVTGVQAGEPIVADFGQEEPLVQQALVQVASPEALVMIAPVPMPAAVIELANYAPRAATLHQAKRVKAAKVARARSMLSRSAREQIVLAANAGAKPDDHARISASDDEDDETGLDDLDLHRSFSQPKIAKAPDQADDEGADIDLPEHVKLRLLMARTKAVEAHILNQVAKAAAQADEELSDNVKLRLQTARAKAMQAYHDKFGSV